MSKSEQSAELARILAAANVPVKRIETGVAAMPEATTRDWERLARTPMRDRETDAINERHYVTDHRGEEHCRNGLGEWLY